MRYVSTKKENIECSVLKPNVEGSKERYRYKYKNSPTTLDERRQGQIRYGPRKGEKDFIVISHFAQIVSPGLKSTPDAVKPLVTGILIIHAPPPFLPSSSRQV